MNKYYQKTKTNFTRLYHQADGAGETLLIIGLILLLVAFFVTIVGAALLFPPFVLVWAINTLVPIFGWSIVIPYSIPILLAISVTMIVIQTVIFKKPIIEINIKR